MFYLRKVIAIIENSAFRNAIDKLEKTLQEQKIVLQCFWIEELQLAEVTAETVFDAVWEKFERCATGETEGGKADCRMRVEVNGAGQDSVSADTACLWFTDMADIVKVLSQMEQPVLALLHENNRNQDLSAALYACEEPGELDGGYLDKVYRRYKRLPWEILQTDRCLIRETIPEDAEAFFEIYKEPSITRYMEGLYPKIEQEKQYINDYIDKVYSFYGFGVWTVIKRDSGEIIGRAGLSYREGFEEPEIGFVIGKHWQRQGYAEEICNAILDYAREELEFDVVQAFVRPENVASLGLCKKLGMKLERETVIGGIKHCRMMRNSFEQ